METPGVFVFGSPIWLCCIPQRGGADSFGGPSVIAYYPDLSVIALLVDHLNSNSKGLVIILDYCSSLCTETVAEEKFMKGPASLDLRGAFLFDFFPLVQAPAIPVAKNFSGYDRSLDEGHSRWKAMNLDLALLSKTCC